MLNPSKRLDSIIHNSIEDWPLAQSKAEIPGEVVVVVFRTKYNSFKVSLLDSLTLIRGSVELPS